MIGPLLKRLYKPKNQAGSETPCNTCRWIREPRPNLFACEAHDKLLLNDFPPTKCKDYEPRTTEDTQC